MKALRGTGLRVLGTQRCEPTTRRRAARGRLARGEVASPPVEPRQVEERERQARAPDAFLGVVTLPRPSEVTEAHFAGVALCALPRKSWLERLEASVTLFTLERTFHDRAILCCWSGEEHLNFDQDVEPSERAFADAVRQHMTTSE